MEPSDIEAHITETRELQRILRIQGEADGEARATHQGQKRRGDDENYGPTFCVAVANQQQQQQQPSGLQQQPSALPDMSN